MIARNVTMHLKPNSVAEFTQTFQKEIIPLLRNRRASTTKSRSLSQANAMRWESVSGINKRTRTPIAEELTQTW